MAHTVLRGLTLIVFFVALVGNAWTCDSIVSRKLLIVVIAHRLDQRLNYNLN